MTNKNNPTELLSIVTVRDTKDKIHSIPFFLLEKDIKKEISNIANIKEKNFINTFADKLEIISTGTFSRATGQIYPYKKPKNYGLVSKLIKDKK